jgi:hypothetical protein
MVEIFTRLHSLDIFKRKSASSAYTAVGSPTSDDKEAFRDDFDRASTEAALLSNAQNEHHNSSNTLQQRKKLVYFLVALFVVTVALIAIVAGLSSYIQHQRSPKMTNHYTYSTHVTTPTKNNDKSHPCGSSAVEARARKCTFNQLTWAWIPPSCPPYTESEFVSAESKPWVYWQDLERTTEVKGPAWEEMLDGERAVFSEKREHLTHCVFMSLALAQLLHSGGAYWDKLVDYEHHEHCAKMLLGEIRKGHGIAENVGARKRDEEMEEWGDGGWESLQTFVGGANFDQDCEGRNVHVAGMEMGTMKNGDEEEGGGYR